MAKTDSSTLKRYRRKLHIRKKLRGTGERPRLTVFRSDKHIYVQIIDDDKGQTLASASTLSPEYKAEGKYGGNKAAAVRLGEIIAKKAIEAGITAVVFDRNGYLFHGRVKALADSARNAGLKF